MKTEAMTPEAIIEQLAMRPHPEGGHFVETFRDQPVDGGRGALTCIYFLLRAGEISAWHRIDATEVWHFAAGAPLGLSLSADGHKVARHELGPDLSGGQRPQVVIPPGCWQSARSRGAWTLVSCIVAPAFEFSGFELAPPGWQPAGG